MKFNLNEDNQEVDDLVKYIELKIIQLKKQNLDKDLLVRIQQTYLKIINPWMEVYYLHSENMNIKEENILKDNLLEFITYLNQMK